MAEKKKPKTAKAARPAKAKAAPARKASPKKAPAKARKAAARPKASPRRASRPSSSTFDITKLIDHPLVADLLTVGAMAAVGAIADHHVKSRTGEAEAGSSKAVKAAGKAAAAAVGKRLMTEVNALRKPSRKTD
jgi:hypothetical protein